MTGIVSLAGSDAVRRITLRRPVPMSDAITALRGATNLDLSLSFTAVASGDGMSQTRDVEFSGCLTKRAGESSFDVPLDLQALQVSDSAATLTLRFAGTPNDDGSTVTWTIAAVPPVPVITIQGAPVTITSLTGSVTTAVTEISPPRGWNCDVPLLIDCTLAEGATAATLHIAGTTRAFGQVVDVVVDASDVALTASVGVPRNYGVKIDPVNAGPVIFGSDARYRATVSGLLAGQSVGFEWTCVGGATIVGQATTVPPNESEVVVHMPADGSQSRDGCVNIICVADIAETLPDGRVSASAARVSDTRCVTPESEADVLSRERRARLAHEAKKAPLLKPRHLADASGVVQLDHLGDLRKRGIGDKER